MVDCHRAAAEIAHVEISMRIDKEAVRRRDAARDRSDRRLILAELREDVHGLTALIRYVDDVLRQRGADPTGSRIRSPDEFAIPLARCEEVQTMTECGALRWLRGRRRELRAC